MDFLAWTPAAVQRLDCACCGRAVSNSCQSSGKARFISGPPDRSYLLLGPLPLLSTIHPPPSFSSRLSPPISRLFNLCCLCSLASRERESTSANTPCAILRPFLPFLPNLLGGSSLPCPRSALFQQHPSFGHYPFIILRALPPRDHPAVLFCLATPSAHFCSRYTKLARVRPKSNHLFTSRLAQHHPSQLPSH